MANWTTLKAAIANVIKTNGNQEITGAVLQNTLNSIVNAVGENATFAGVATPSTNPGVPDGPVFYLASQIGAYSNFNGLSVNIGEIAIFIYKTSWQKQSLNYEITEVNVSKIFPTGGIDGTNKYTLETAIAMIPASLRSIGIKCSFINEGGELETWTYRGGMFTNIDSWNNAGAKAITEIEASLKERLDYTADMNKDFTKNGEYAVSSVGGNLTISNTTGGSWIMNYSVPKGGIIRITANDTNNVLICFLNSNEIKINYGTQLSDYFVDGESGARELGKGETLEYRTKEDTFLYIVPGASHENVPQEIYIAPGSYSLVKSLENEQKINDTDAQVKSVKQITESNKTEIDNISDKYTTSVSFSKFQGGMEKSDENGSYKEVSEEINAYSTNKCAVYYPDTEARNLPANRYSIFAKLMITTEEKDPEYNAELSVLSAINIETIIKRKNIQFEKLYFLKIGDFDWKGNYQSNLSVGIGGLRKVDQNVVAETMVTCKWYGIYIIPESDVNFDNADAFSNLLDYENDTTYITRASLSSLHAQISENAEHAKEATRAGASGISDRLTTSLAGGLIGVYGDSLVTYISWKPLGEYFGAKASAVGQGGGEICNNKSTVKQGFCTLERCALLPKQMKLLIIYAGANDVIRRRNSDSQKMEIDPDLLGNMEDKPLSIVDMCNYRVTAANMATMNTPGRTGRFYQGIKTLLRNIMILFPNTQIIVSTQHRYYYYINPDNDSFTDYPVLNYGNEVKRKALIEVAEEFGVPVCDLWSTCGVNEYNLRNKLVDLAGVAIHPNTALYQKECSIFINSILTNADKIAVEKYNPYPDYDSKNKYTQEMQEWVVDLRNEEAVNPTSLTDAIEQFQTICQENSIEVKNNMYLVFENEQGTSVGYFLTNKDNVANISSWEQWTLQDIDDPNEPN